MPILIVLVALILAWLVFGPVLMGLFGLAAAGLGAVLALGLLGLIVLCGGVVVLFALAWCVWWICDRDGAMRAYREAESGPERHRTEVVFTKVRRRR